MDVISPINGARHVRTANAQMPPGSGEPPFPLSSGVPPWARSGSTSSRCSS